VSSRVLNVLGTNLTLNAIDTSKTIHRSYNQVESGEIETRQKELETAEYQDSEGMQGVKTLAGLNVC